LYAPCTTPAVVLVVEDELLVRLLVVDVLAEAGFEVVEASTADYAVLVLDDRPDIRVVFTDVDMPGRLNGFQLARHVQDHYPCVGVVIGSGKCRPAPDEVAPGTSFLQKPYPLGTLVREVRRLAARPVPARDEKVFAKVQDWRGVVAGWQRTINLAGRPAALRCYFHLSKGDETIRDEHGIEVPDLDHARAEVMKAIAELRATQPRLAREGAGWTLTVADASGAALFTIPLDVGLAS
jgi:two-component system, response regulator PdtaR